MSKSTKKYEYQLTAKDGDTRVEQCCSNDGSVSALNPVLATVAFIPNIDHIHSSTEV